RSNRAGGTTPARRRRAAGGQRTPAMKRELKRQIKQDEFVSWVDHTAAWLRAHESEAKATAAILLALGIGWLGVSSYMSNRAQKADEAFDAALRTFHAPVTGEPPPAPGQKVCATPAD